MEDNKTARNARTPFVAEARPIVSRREVVFRLLTWLAAGCLVTIVWRFIRGIPARCAKVVFHRAPKTGEVMTNAGAYLVGATQGVIALSDRCPHLGCRVNHDPEAGGFRCPCHGSRFSLDGRLLEGPARKNMSALELRVDEKTGTYTTHSPVIGSIH